LQLHARLVTQLALALSTDNQGAECQKKVTAVDQTLAGQMPRTQTPFCGPPKTDALNGAVYPDGKLSNPSYLHITTSQRLPRLELCQENGQTLGKFL
jgi:hypothetical protein